ncbi:hypothetical protein D3C85_1132700 [compost metagenome]
MISVLHIIGTQTRSTFKNSRRIYSIFSQFSQSQLCQVIVRNPGHHPTIQAHSGQKNCYICFRTGNMDIKRIRLHKSQSQLGIKT